MGKFNSFKIIILLVFFLIESNADPLNKINNLKNENNFEESKNFLQSYHLSRIAINVVLCLEYKNIDAIS